MRVAVLLGEHLETVGLFESGQVLALQVLDEGDLDDLVVVEESLEVRKRVGYLPETVPLYTDMTALEYLTFWRENRIWLWKI